ncbi:uncharacterized protein Bfra_006935 [Botrytis fragariae]|uniref:Uncharacterized protein n=1 Tax=Botrytis fragariae TaxID=1964551 RepID=A0A8H6B5D5_9HELO|nr:uncharacterized protein Bfra_006935 [Botrytis fragariae]KAF5879728.1 hypothetical protein Bfra_006935 [Botrytis fragariae]
MKLLGTITTIDEPIVMIVVTVIFALQPPTSITLWNVNGLPNNGRKRWLKRETRAQMHLIKLRVAGYCYHANTPEKYIHFLINLSYPVQVNF